MAGPGKWKVKRGEYIIASPPNHLLPPQIDAEVSGIVKDPIQEEVP